MPKRMLLALWIACLAGGSALADPITDCNQFADPLRQIKGCTGFIRRGGLDTDALSSAYINRGIAQGQIGKIAQAVSDFSEAIRLDPKSALAHYNRGNAYFDLKKLAEAAADFDAAVAIDPSFALAFYNRGLVYEKRGDKDRAIADYVHALNLDPDMSSAREKLQQYGVKPVVDTASRPAG